MERNKLEKNLGPGAIWAVAVGSIIGWGCFIQGANWTIRAGGPLPLIIGFILGGLLMIVIGYSYSYMIAKFPVAGGEFAYAYKGFGRNIAFVCGWMLSLGYMSTVALNATALPLLVGFLLPDTLNFSYMYTIAGHDVYFGEVLLSCFFIILFGFKNYRGVKSVGNLQLVMVLIMCLAVVVSVAGTVFTGNFKVENLQPLYGVDKSFMAGLISILALSPFLYCGFDCIPQAAEEYDFPPHKAKFLITSSLVVGALIYAAISLVTDVVIPWQQVINLDVQWYTGEVLSMAMGRAGVMFVAISVCMGIFTGLNGFYMTASRLLFSMGRARMLPQVFGSVHKEYNTPTVCIVFVGAICCLCPFFGREVITWVVDMSAVGTSIGYFFTCACAFVLIRYYGTPADENRISQFTALAGAGISFGILLLLILPFSPAFMLPQSFIALGVWVGLGVIFYFVSAKRLAAISKQDMDYLILEEVQPESKRPHILDSKR